MGHIAVIDTETNWSNEVMSLGAVVADGADFRLLDTRYYILDPAYRIGGLFSSRLWLREEFPTRVGSREETISDLRDWLSAHSVTALFAYNAVFDKSHLPELGDYPWHDIMRLAAYRQYNPRIGAEAECCRTGRLKRNYGVQPMMRLLSGNRFYFERHNALRDAVDELKIMELLALEIEVYKNARL